MGISKDVIGLMSIAINAIGKKTFKGVSICELGNQRMRKGASKHKTFKSYLTSLGATHLSIDINGKDGSKKWDLAKPIKKKFEEFDVVTNYGTSEHVSDQHSCFENMHCFCKPGGAMVHVVPLKGTYKGHSLYYYTKKFFKDIAKKNNYEIIMCDEKKRSIGKTVVCCIYIKRDSNAFIY